MTALTPLDRAHRAAHAATDADAAMARFYALLIETPLMVPVVPREDDAPIAPQVFPLSTGPVALAFDDDGRMTAFFEEAVTYVGLPGRSLLTSLAEANLGLGLNLGDAPSAMVLDAETVRWIAGEMGGDLEAADLSGALTLQPPKGAPRALLASLAERVAQLPGLVREAWLVSVTDEAEQSGLVLMVLPGSAAGRAMPGVVTMLGRVASVHGDAQPVSVGVLDDHHRLLGPARRQGQAMHSPPPTEKPAQPPSSNGPPRLR